MFVPPHHKIGKVSSTLLPELIRATFFFVLFFKLPRIRSRVFISTLPLLSSFLSLLLLNCFVATFRVAKPSRQTRKLWLVGVATDRDARRACLRFFSCCVSCVFCFDLSFFSSYCLFLLFFVVSFVFIFLLFSFVFHCFPCVSLVFLIFLFFPIFYCL